MRFNNNMKGGKGSGEGTGKTNGVVQKLLVVEGKLIQQLVQHVKALKAHNFRNVIFPSVLHPSKESVLVCPFTQIALTINSIKRINFFILFDFQNLKQKMRPKAHFCMSKWF